MEALTALQIAGSLIQFLDFGGKLLSKSRKLYRSADGVLSENVDLEVITRDLRTLLQDLNRKLLENRPISTFKSQSDDEQALDELCRRCIRIANELITRLNDLKIDPGSDQRNLGDHEDDSERIKGQKQSSSTISKSEGWRSLLAPDRPKKGHIFRKWDAFRKALEATWNKDDIESMVAMMREFRCEIEFRILVMFRATISQLVVQQSHFSHQLTHSTNTILESFMNTRDDLANQLRCQVEKLQYSQLCQKYPGTRRPERIEEYLKGELDLCGKLQFPRGVERENESAQELPARAYEVEEILLSLMTENSVLQSLCFDSMADRMDSVEKAYRNTFQWIFEEPGSSQRPWSNYISWLRQDSGIYWVNGKAASGKSTLMRYLQDHEITRCTLKEWAGSMPLEICSFFFWNIGDEFQRSQKGLLRSLLHEILQRHRELIPVAMPEVWDIWSARANAILSSKTSLDSPLLPSQPKPWSMSQLKLSFRNLLQALQSKVKLCLFIDGLDEYDGDYFEIAELFEEYAESPNIKLCLSSRPIPAFEQAFQGQPSLRVQDLTHGDIRHYVQDNLYHHKYMKVLSKQKTGEVALLVDDVVAKARGVFLWVKLVVRSLLRGLSDYNRISDLQKRVEYLPDDLEALYSHMFKMNDPFYLEQASQIFQIFRAAQLCNSNRLTLLTLSWADDEDENLAETASVRLLSEEEVISRCKVMDARLKSVCAGLLESIDTRFSDIAPDSKVLFLHRTVSDWMAKPEVWSSITSHTRHKEFSPNLALLKSCIMQLKSANVSPSLSLDMGIITSALQFALAAEHDLDQGFPKLLDQLDVAASYQWRIGMGNFEHERDIQSEASSATSSFSDHNTSKEQFMEFEMETNELETGRPTKDSSHGIELALSSSPRVSPALLARYSGFRMKVDVAKRTNYLGHWSCAVEIPGLDISGLSTFYDLARAMGLSHYARMKFESANIADQDVNQHLLLHSVGEKSDPEPSVLRRILNSGTDPNLSYDGLTPWEQVLLSATSHFNETPCGHLHCREHLPDPKWKKTAKNWAEVIRDFLDHGANPDFVTRNHQTLQGHPRLSVMNVLETHFPPFLKDESVKIKETLMQKVTVQPISNLLGGTKTKNNNDKDLEIPAVRNMSEPESLSGRKTGETGSNFQDPKHPQHLSIFGWMISFVMGIGTTTQQPVRPRSKDDDRLSQ